MHAKILNLLQVRSELFCSGQFEELAKHYHLPFVAYHEGGITILRSRSQIARAYFNMSAQKLARGIVKLDVEVVSVGEPRNGKFKVRSRYSEINSSNEVVSKLDVTQFYIETPEGPLVEMVEFLHCQFGKLCDRESQMAVALH